MLRFIKRINEQHKKSKLVVESNDPISGGIENATSSPSCLPPILVHCSAGVGRSGTLIAIDTLSQAMDEEGAVNIFQTVSDLRHQRNYLVQSVKQYQFVYRAIMEFAQFGDTEMDAAKIKEHWVALTEDKKDGLL